jgi:hypothetical protein
MAAPARSTQPPEHPPVAAASPPLGSQPSSPADAATTPRPPQGGGGDAGAASTSPLATPTIGTPSSSVGGTELAWEVVETPNAATDVDDAWDPYPPSAAGYTLGKLVGETAVQTARPSGATHSAVWCHPVFFFLGCRHKIDCTHFILRQFAFFTRIPTAWRWPKEALARLHDIRLHSCRLTIVNTHGRARARPWDDCLCVGVVRLAHESTLVRAPCLPSSRLSPTRPTRPNYSPTPRVHVVHPVAHSSASNITVHPSS